MAPIAIGAVYGLIQGGAWVVQHAIVNPLFERRRYGIITTRKSLQRLSVC